MSSSKLQIDLSLPRCPAYVRALNSFCPAQFYDDVAAQPVSDAGPRERALRYGLTDNTTLTLTALENNTATASLCTQFTGVVQAGEVYPNGDPLTDLVRHHAAHYGSLIRTRYGEPYFTYETMRADDVTTLDVATF